MIARIETYQGSITELNVDVIVNAANTGLLGGGGVDGAIHRAAGLGLLDECRTLGDCTTGDAKITKGYNLKARFVIHTVGPVWCGGDYDEAELLANCYRRSLELAAEHHLKSIAFPAISTGAFGYPLEAATQIAIDTVRNWLSANMTIEMVVFVCFDGRTFSTYERLLCDHD
jgi:O-acetyl-ADP-ribose deacetylase (regulator of RNase III)